MRSEQYDLNDEQPSLPTPCYEGFRSQTAYTEDTRRKRSATGMLTFGIAWLFGLEALLSEDEI
jgi:hypothetical protein